jgi:hypothetical protein
MRQVETAQCRSVCRPSEVHPEFVSRGDEHNIIRNVARLRGRDGLLLCHGSPAQARNKQRNSSFHVADCSEEGEDSTVQFSPRLERCANCRNQAM